MAFLGAALPAIASVAGSIFGGGSSGSVGSNAAQTNATLQAAQNENNTGEAAIAIETMKNQLATDTRAEIFNEAQNERSETQREVNQLRSLSVAQDQADDKIVSQLIQEVAGR